MNNLISHLKHHDESKRHGGVSNRNSSTNELKKHQEEKKSNNSEYKSLFINHEFYRSLENSNYKTICNNYDAYKNDFNKIFNEFFNLNIEDFEIQKIKGKDFNKKLFTLLYYSYTNFDNSEQFYTHCKFNQILIHKIFNRDNNSKTWNENKYNNNHYFSEIHFHFLSRIMFIINEVLEKKKWIDEEPYLEFLEFLLFILEQEAISGIYSNDSGVSLKSIIVNIGNDNDSSIDYNNIYISNSHIVEHITRLRSMNEELRNKIGERLRNALIPKRKTKTGTRETRGIVKTSQQMKQISKKKESGKKESEKKESREMDTNLELVIGGKKNKKLKKTKKNYKKGKRKTKQKQNKSKTKTKK